MRRGFEKKRNRSQHCSKRVFAVLEAQLFSFFWKLERDFLTFLLCMGRSLSLGAFHIPLIFSRRVSDSLVKLAKIDSKMLGSGLVHKKK